MDLKEIIRQYFRVAVDPPDRIKLSADGREYPIVDVGDRGVGIRLSPEDIFLSVQDELNLELNLDGIIHTVQGKIVHISPDTSGRFLCGIEFIRMDRQCRDQLMRFLQKHRAEMFTGGDRKA